MNADVAKPRVTDSVGRERKKSNTHGVNGVAPGDAALKMRKQEETMLDISNSRLKKKHEQIGVRG